METFQITNTGETTPNHTGEGVESEGDRPAVSSAETLPAPLEFQPQWGAIDISPQVRDNSKADCGASAVDLGIPSGILCHRPPFKSLAEALSFISDPEKTAYLLDTTQYINRLNISEEHGVSANGDLELSSRRESNLQEVQKIPAKITRELEEGHGIFSPINLNNCYGSSNAGDMCGNENCPQQITTPMPSANPLNGGFVKSNQDISELKNNHKELRRGGPESWQEERQPGERQPGERQPGRRQPGERWSGERRPGERQSGERQSGERWSEERLSEERQSGERQSEERLFAERRSEQRQYEERWSKERHRLEARRCWPSTGPFFYHYNQAYFQHYYIMQMSRCDGSSNSESQSKQSHNHCHYS